MFRDIQGKEKKTNFVQNVYCKNTFAFSFPTIYCKKQTNKQSNNNNNNTT